jgi:nucleotide-binding universal stress UspA family protein
MYNHILVPVDGSTQSSLAIKAATALAEALDAKITLFHAAHFQFHLTSIENTAFNIRYREEFQEEAKRHAELVLADSAKLSAAKTDHHFTFSNDPATAIIEAAKKFECDLIVMGSHGHRGIKSLLLGSETHKVLSHTKIPVLVVR